MNSLQVRLFVKLILAPTTLLRYGITEGIELRLLSQFETIKLQDQLVQGISDLEIGTSGGGA